MRGAGMFITRKLQSEHERQGVAVMLAACIFRLQLTQTDFLNKLTRIKILCRMAQHKTIFRDKVAWS